MSKMTIREMSGIIVEQVIGMMTEVVKCKKIEIEVQVENVIDPGQGIGAIQEMAEIDLKAGITVGIDQIVGTD